MTGLIVLWFKRDLRVADHPALAHAAATGGPVLPLYVVEPEYWRLPDTSARQWAFTAECLDSLRAALAALGCPLVVRTGDAVETFTRLHARHPVARIVSHEETGNLWTFARDRAVGAWARGQGIPWDERPQSGVVRRLRSRDGWAAARDRWLMQPMAAPPRALPPLPQGIDPGPIPTATDLGLAPDVCPQRQTGGRDPALSLLGSFLTDRGQTYRAAMASPVTGETACSRLSPHLALGTLSGREAHRAAEARLVEVRGTREGWTGAMRSFQARLAWRDHFLQKAEDAPDIEARCLHSAYEHLRPRTPDATRLAAWEAGETGLPFVDACMRYLAATGWLNFRMRSMLMAVASYHLWLDWRATGPHLARQFTDYEPGIHWAQTQMQSGTTGMNTVRMYNPVKQGHDQDPTGAFTRAWVPELADVPDRFVQTPWDWDGASTLLDRRYPRPIVDLKAAAAFARDAVWGVRRGEAFRAEAAQVVRKHASRKDGGAGRHFVNDREPKPRRPRGKPSDSKQLAMDL
jgi:deoxyribodipyrimidine photo-lyase